MVQSGVSALIFCFFCAEYCGIPVKLTVSAAIRFGRIARGGLVGEMTRFLGRIGELYWTSSEPEGIVSLSGDCWLRKVGSFLLKSVSNIPPGPLMIEVGEKSPRASLIRRADWASCSSKAQRRSLSSTSNHWQL